MRVWRAYAWWLGLLALAPLALPLALYTRRTALRLPPAGGELCGVAGEHLPGPPLRLLVLGDMGEVGHQGPQFHDEVGHYAAERGIEALTGAGVQLAERGVAVDQQDRVVGCGLGHRGEAAGRILIGHEVRFYLGKKIHHLAAAKQIGWQLCAGSQTRKNHTRQTRRSPTHSRHKARRRRTPPEGLMTVQVDSIL